MATHYMGILSQDAEQERNTADYIRQHRTWFIALVSALIVIGVCRTPQCS